MSGPKEFTGSSDLATPPPIEEERAFSYTVEARDSSSSARLGTFATPHGSLSTPAFMPVGTRATVKGLLPEQVRQVGTRMLLANTYHLALRPGEQVVRELGGLHRFMGWDGPILTDSGGYQIFSLAHLTELSERGARVRSVVDGSIVDLTPERAIDIQRALGADVIMALDHCASSPTDRDAVEHAKARTDRWLARCVRQFRGGRTDRTPQALFGIVQGGAFEDLRRESALATVDQDLPGYAIGGVSVGEQESAMHVAVESAVRHLPEDRPRYLMGVGSPRDFLWAIERGVDLFDCVTPTRHGRNHQAYTREGRLNLRNQRFAKDPRPVEEDCDCPACVQFSRGYLRHLCKSGEMLAGALLSLHNLRFFHRLMEDVREAIPTGNLAAVRKRYEGAADSL